MNRSMLALRITKLKPGDRFIKYTPATNGSRLTYVDRMNYTWLHIIEVSKNLIVAEEYPGTPNFAVSFGKAPIGEFIFKTRDKFLNAHISKDHREAYLHYVDNKAPIDHVYPALLREKSKEEISSE